MKKRIVAGILALIIVGGAFFGGMKYQDSKISKMSPQDLFAKLGSTFGNRDGNGNNVFRFGNGNSVDAARRNGGGMIVGEIISKDANSITVKSQDGGSKIVLISSSTNVSKLASITIDDLVIGKTVTVNGSDNQDGSITAQNIQLRPLISPATSPSN